MKVHTGAHPSQPNPEHPKDEPKSERGMASNRNACLRRDKGVIKRFELRRENTLIACVSQKKRMPTARGSAFT